MRRLLMGALGAAAAIAVAEERFGEAAQLTGAVERVAEELGTTPRLTESGDLVRARAAAADALGDEAFAAAVEAGRRLSQEQSVALTLGNVVGA